MDNLAKTHQEAILESDKVFVLKLGPRHADAALVIRDGVLQIEAPGVDTYLSQSVLREMRDVIDFALRMGD